MQPTLQDNQLMSKHSVFSFKPQLRLEWRGQDGQNETEQPDHSASLGDSITSSTQIRFSVHTPICSNKSTIKGTPASLAKPAARKAAARIPCNVQAPMRRAGRTDWIEAALILVSVACEVESEMNLRCRPSWQKPIYSDDIHRLLRYFAG